MRIFGFDLGIASIGWAVINMTEHEKNNAEQIAANGEIIAMGVRCFDQAQSGEERRIFRGQRRRIRHRAMRMKSIRKLFRDNKIIDIPEPVKTNNGWEQQFNPTDEVAVWELRAKHAFERILTPHEYGRVLYHLAKHRGYDDITYPIRIKTKDQISPDDSTQSKDDLKARAAIIANKTNMEPNKTMAMMIYEKNINNYRFRNSDKDFSNSIPRSEISRESEMIFAHQCKLGNNAISRELFNQWQHIAFAQRKFNESASPLAKSINDMRGVCKHEPSIPVAPKESPTAQLFVAWSKINQNHFSGEQGQKIIDLLYKNVTVTYANIRKILNLDDDYKFYDLDYKKDDCEKTKFYSFSGYHKLKKYTSDLELMDKIIEIIATQKTESAIESSMQHENILPEYINEIKKLETKYFIKISTTALKKIIPEMEKGMSYAAACEKVGYNHNDMGESFIDLSDKLPDGYLKRIDFKKLGNRVTSPAVKRTMAQFRKVYNAMVKTYGIPDAINLEVARDLKKSSKQREEISKQINANKKLNQELADTYGERNILRFKLYQEQCCKCPYCGETLNLNEIDKYEIDHILPYSRSLDNSTNNKVLVHHECNQSKGNRTPFEYIGEANWYDFVIRINSIFKNPRKKEKLLNRTFINNENEFVARNACDNATISVFVSKYLKDGAGISPQKIQMRNGSLTAFLRHQWGLEKNRDESDTHHAQDAVVIACATNGMVKYLQTWSGRMGTDAVYRNKYKKIFASPWENFRQEILDKKENICISRPTRKSATGQIHKDTIEKRTKNTKADKFIVRHGVADRGALFRFDIFKHNNKFIAMPIYLSDIRNTDKSFIPDGCDESEFVMTLHKDDYISIKHKNGTIYNGYIMQYTTSDQFRLYDDANRRVYAIESDVTQPGDVIVIDNIYCKVIKFDTNENRVLLKNILTGAEIYIDGNQQTDRKGKIKKEIKLSQKYTQLRNDIFVSIGTLTSIDKYDVDILGHKKLSIFRPRQKINNIKHKGRKQPKRHKHGVANPSIIKTV